MSIFQEGVRVVLTEMVERHPVYIAAGATGIISEWSESLCSVKLDAVIDGFEEWDNHLEWVPDDGTEGSHPTDARVNATAQLREVAS